MKNVLIFVGILILLSFTVSAHEEEAPSVVVNGYKIEFLQPLENVSAGTDVSIEFRVESTVTNESVSGLKASITFDPNIELSLQERPGGVYYTVYRFPRAGVYEIHQFSIGDQSFSVDFHMRTVGETIDYTNYAIFTIPILGLIGAVFFVVKQKNWKMAIGSVVVSLILAGLAYSVNFYFTSGAATQGVVVCDQNDPTKCTWQAHIHAFIIPQICGEERRFSIEVGNLNDPHTHEEKNTIHWHDRLPYDGVTGTILNTTPLTLGAFFDSIGIPFSDTGIYEHSNGNTCPDGSVGTLKVFVNSESYYTKNLPWTHVENPSEYVWSDREIVYIAFDNRSKEQVLSFLATIQFNFPGIGLG